MLQLSLLTLRVAAFKIQKVLSKPKLVAKELIDFSRLHLTFFLIIFKVDAHAIYVRNLPLSATPQQLEEEFKRFGTIKNEGIQVRSNKIQGFCYGFIEFEDASAVQTAIEASPVMIGERQCYVEEKRTTGSRGGSRGGRFAPGRGGNFRGEGLRGRGTYNGGRGYGRGELNYRSDYGGRGGGRGGSSRGDVGYQRVDHSGTVGGRGARATSAATAAAK